MTSNACNIERNADQVLAISSIPMQNADFACTFSADEGLIKGTVFPELFLPFCKEGETR